LIVSQHAKAQYSVVFKEKLKNLINLLALTSDKSLSIRSILFGAIVEGVSEVKNLLESDDVISTINFIKKLGVKLKKLKKANI
jgi:3-phosphoshikimate 1-carboxyvinyltransferase